MTEDVKVRLGDEETAIIEEVQERDQLNKSEAIRQLIQDGHGGYTFNKVMLEIAKVSFVLMFAFGLVMLDTGLYVPVVWAFAGASIGAILLERYADVVAPAIGLESKHGTPEKG